MQAMAEGGMNGKLLGFVRKALKLVLIELLVPGGTLVVLALLLSGSSALAIPEWRNSFPEPPEET